MIDRLVASPAVRRSVTGVAAIAIVGQLILFTNLVLPTKTGDSDRYLDLAASLERGHGFGLGTGAAYEPEAWRMPGYPVFIVAAHALPGTENVDVLIAQCLLYMATVALIYVAVRKTFGAGMAAAFLAGCALYPFVAAYAGQLSTEILSGFAIALAFYLIVDGKAPGWAASGAILGIGALVRPNLLLMAPVFVLANLLVDIRSWRKPACLLLGTFVVVSPWVVRNAWTFGVPTPGPVIKGTGVVLLVSSWQSLVPADDLYQYGTTGRSSPKLEHFGLTDQARSINRALGVPAKTVFATPDNYPGNETKLQLDRLCMAAALENIRAHPAEYMKSVAWNMVRMWFTGRLPNRLPRAVKLALIAEGGLVVLLGILGAAMAVARAADDRQRRVVYTAVVSLIYFTFSMCWFHTEARYTIPVRLFLLFFASYAVVQTANSFPRNVDLDRD